MSRVKFGLIALALAASAVACNRSVASMSGAYYDGDYGQVLQSSSESEGEFDSWKPRKQAHYCIYRGAAHLAAGELKEARYWLGQADSYRREFPGLVRGGHVEVLDQALARLDERTKPSKKAKDADDDDAEEEAEEASDEADTQAADDEKHGAKRSKKKSRKNATADVSVEVEQPQAAVDDEGASDDEKAPPPKKKATERKKRASAEADAAPAK